jgi:hypothetical protein
MITPISDLKLIFRQAVESNERINSSVRYIPWEKDYIGGADLHDKDKIGCDLTVPDVITLSE